MFSRRALVSAALLALSGVPFASAQVIESGGLGDIDPWGAGYISKGQGAFSTDLWTGSTAEDLVPLMRRTAVGRVTMSPSEHELLRRVLLSPASRPQGDSKGLLEERIRMLLAIGETRAAIDLMRRSGDAGLRGEGDRLSIDMALATGETSRACAPSELAGANDAFGLKRRAVCLALAGDDAGTELAIELAANSGVDDSWLINALLATVVDTPNKPPARLTDGLSISASFAAGLTAEGDALTGIAPHYALALAGREELPAGWRLQAAGIAAEAGLSEPEIVRDAFASLAADPEYSPGSALERAMLMVNDTEADPADRARSFSDALRSAVGRPERFASVADILSPAIESLPRSEATASRAVVFARAALARGDASGAAAWVRVPDGENLTPSEAFDLAMTDGLVVLVRGRPDAATLDAITARLISSASDSQRRSEIARLFALWSVFDVSLNADARAVVAANGKASGLEIDDGELLRLRTLTGDATAAELVFRLIRASNGNPERLSTRDAVDIVTTLRRAGLDADARRFALEAMKYWMT